MCCLQRKIYVVKAQPKKDLMVDLRQEIISGKISRLKPFGEELHHGLENVKIIKGTHIGWKRIIAPLHLQWKGEVYWIAILTLSHRRAS